MDNKEAEKKVNLELRNLKQTEIQRLKNRGKIKERLRLRCENKTLGTALDPRANGAWLSKLTQ